MVFCIAVIATAARAAVLQVPNSIASNMVLQKGTAQLYGWAAAGEKVSVSIDGVYTNSTIAQPWVNGTWQWFVVLHEEASMLQRTILIEAPSGTIKLQNVLFGDVYLCSGQSNVRVCFFLLVPLLLSFEPVMLCSSF